MLPKTKKTFSTPQSLTLYCYIFYIANTAHSGGSVGDDDVYYIFIFIIIIFINIFFILSIFSGIFIRRKLLDKELNVLHILCATLISSLVFSKDNQFLMFFFTLYMLRLKRMPFLLRIYIFNTSVTLGLKIIFLRKNNVCRNGLMGTGLLNEICSTFYVLINILLFEQFRPSNYFDALIEEEF